MRPAFVDGAGTYLVGSVIIRPEVGAIEPALLSFIVCRRAGGAMNPDRRHWDERYRYARASAPPAPWMLEWSERLAPGRVLDLACGTGGNLLAFAERGWRVIGVDVSPVALRIVRATADRRGLDVALVAASLEHFPLPHAHFDLVSVCSFLDRSLVGVMTAALRPGGYLLYETFTTAQLELESGPRSPAFMLESGELPRLFPALEVVAYEEGIYQHGESSRALARLVARRPA